MSGTDSKCSWCHVTHTQEVVSGSVQMFLSYHRDRKRQLIVCVCVCNRRAMQVVMILRFLWRVRLSWMISLLRYAVCLSAPLYMHHNTKCISTL